MIKICTYCEAYYNADTPLGGEDIVLTLLGENNVPTHTRTDSGQTQQNYYPKDWFHLPNCPYCSWTRIDV